MASGHASGSVFAAVGGGYSYAYGFPFYSTIGFGGVPFSYVPPFLMMAPAGMGPLLNPAPLPQGGGMLAGPMPPPGLNLGWPVPAPLDPAKARKPDPSRAAQLVTLGDRNFRAGNLHREAERYTQAVSADPSAAMPRVRMAQVAVNRGQYAEAANHYRDAMVAEPGWLIHAPDVQAIYGEPADFAKQIARLETHLQADPQDRDGWFVLGAQWYLSGQTRKAADVFLRLTDRKADAASGRVHRRLCTPPASAPVSGGAVAILDAAVGACRYWHGLR